MTHTFTSRGSQGMRICGNIIGNAGLPDLLSHSHIFIWKNNPVRARLKGLRCRILAVGRMGSVAVEFESGERHIVSRRALRRIG